MPTMKDYVAEAEAIASILMPNINTQVLHQYLDARCETLAADNPRFDRERFLLAAQRQAS